MPATTFTTISPLSMIGLRKNKEAILPIIIGFFRFIDRWLFFHG